MTVNEIIELLDKEENKFGGATGKERELNLSVNGDFIGTITSAKLDDWGDGLITDVTLEVEVSRIEYHDDEIRAKVIDEFAELMKEKLKDMQFAEFQSIDVCPCAKTGEECPYINQDIGCQYCAREQTIKEIDKIAEQLKAGGENEIN